MTEKNVRIAGLALVVATAAGCMRQGTTPHQANAPTATPRWRAVESALMYRLAEVEAAAARVAEGGPELDALTERRLALQVALTQLEARAAAQETLDDLPDAAALERDGARAVSRRSRGAAGQPARDSWKPEPIPIMVQELESPPPEEPEEWHYRSHGDDKAPAEKRRGKAGDAPGCVTDADCGGGPCRSGVCSYAANANSRCYGGDCEGRDGSSNAVQAAVVGPTAAAPSLEPALAADLDGLLACFGAERPRDALRIEVRARLTAEGRLRNVSLDATEPLAPRVGDCLESRLEEVRVPVGSDFTGTSISFPLVLRPRP